MTPVASDVRKTSLHEGICLHMIPNLGRWHRVGIKSTNTSAEKAFFVSMTQQRPLPNKRKFAERFRKTPFPVTSGYG